jgi:hypothetical protein
MLKKAILEKILCLEKRVLGTVMELCQPAYLPYQQVGTRLIFDSNVLQYVRKHLQHGTTLRTGD